MTPEAEPRFTLDEARQELNRRRCAEDGHTPSTVIWAGGTPQYAYCDCHETKWVPAAEPLESP